MNLSGINRMLWLWLRLRGGHWTAQDIARLTGHDSQKIFRSLHAMARRKLVEQLAPAAGATRMRYGVSEECLVPLGITVREASTGLTPAARKPADRPLEPPPARSRFSGAPRADGLSAAEAAYAHLAHRLEGASA